MENPKAFFSILACALLVFSCDYIVLPEEESESTFGESKGWSAVATNIGKSATGDLHIDMTIRNETADWSAMRAEDKPAVLISGSGKKTNCDTVFVGTGGHRLAPGFRMRGYVSGKKNEQKIQLICVECKGAEAAPGSKLAIGYSYVTGQYNYYKQEKNKMNGTMKLDLDNVVKDLTYPIAEPLKGLIRKSDSKFTALNKVILTLKAITRTAKGLRLTWQTANPGEYPTYIHIGNTPVVGPDGILYGYYETPDIVSAPITPAGGTAEWTTEVAVPSDIKGFYIMQSVETGKQRLFANYVIDISDK